MNYDSIDEHIDGLKEKIDNIKMSERDFEFVNTILSELEISMKQYATAIAILAVVKEHLSRMSSVIGTEEDEQLVKQLNRIVETEGDE